MIQKLSRRGLYYVHSKYSFNAQNDDTYGNSNEDEEYLILFSDKSLDGGSFSTYFIPSRAYVINENQGEITEGSYVSYKNKMLQNADADETVIQWKKELDDIRSSIIGQFTDIKPRGCSGVVSNVFSYHINVGHGNCSIIVFKDGSDYKMWMVDCSAYDFTSGNHYYLNIKKCLKDIEKQYAVKTISKLFVTHLHFDHYNAVNKLVEKGFINTDTEVWMNIKYPKHSRRVADMLKCLRDAHVRFIDPTTSINTDHIQVLYPTIAFDESFLPPKNKINNSSIVLKFTLDGKSILFPGDIETDGWGEIGCCKNCLKDIDYYCISHHGSINGHLWNCKLMNGLIPLTKCIDSKMQILMGRDTAYRGIYSRQVLGDFDNVKVVEKANTYIKIDWSKNEAKPY
ncbi:MAG: MBL fold metallo-hydrolase [Ruminococcus sp.]|nr:MBL fold metallo-hydrolase [Ruminococcus sp.]